MMKQLVERRVPQILGLYVAGTWMAIEIGDWLIEKFGLPTSLTAYIFIGLAALLPSVALLAWGHGAPGKDRWSRSEKVFLPVNLIAAGAALFLLNPAQKQPAPPTATAQNAMQTRTVVDETGAEAQFEVPVEAFHKNLTVFFFDNQTGDPAYDWISYGLPLLVAYDLDHETPLATVITPFGSDTLKESLLKRGFDALVGEPRSLQATIARSSRSDAMISGALVLQDGVPLVRAQLVDIQSGAVLDDFNGNLEEPLLQIADKISLRSQQELGIDPRSDEENDPLADNLSVNPQAVRLYIDSRMAVELNNDYPTGIETLKKATQLDPTFAAANGALASLFYLSGEGNLALERVQSALDHDYKLSTARRFLARAQRYLYSNDYQSGIKVLTMWTEVDPLNPESFELLGKVLMLTGQDPDRALAVLQQSLALNPGNHTLYSVMASVERSRGNYAEAAELIQTYITARPEDEQAQLQLAEIYTAAEDFDNAREAYQNAELIAPNDLGATLGLATLAMHSGDFEQAAARINRVLERSLTPQQRVQALKTLSELQFIRGQMNDMLATLNAADEVGARFMPPVLRAVRIGMEIVTTKGLLGDFDGALDQIAALSGDMDETMQGFMHMPKMDIYWQQGEQAKAMEALDKAEEFARMRADPAYQPMLATGFVYRAVASNDADSAIRHAKEAVDLMDNSAILSEGSTLFALELRVDLARLLREVGALETAQEILERTLRSSPALPSAHLEMAQIFYDLEQPAAARASLEQALKAWQNADAQYVRFAEAQTLIAALEG